MYQEWKIEHCDEEYAYTHIRVSHIQFRIRELPHCYRMEHVEFRVDVASVLGLAVCVAMLDVHLCHCVSSVSGDSVLCHFGKERSHLSDFPEVWPGVFPSQPSHVYAQETQLPVSSLRRLQPEVPWLEIGFPLLQSAKTPLWPLWPYSKPGTCQTVLAVPNLLALP